MDSLTRTEPLIYAPPHLFIGGLPRVGIGCIFVNHISRFLPPLAIVLLLGMLLFRGERWSRQALGLPYGNDLLFAAIQDQDVPGLKHAILEGASPNATERTTTALMWATSTGNEKLVGCLLDAGAHINEMHNAGRTALVDAIWVGHPSMVQLLLDRGADPNEYSSRMGTPLYAAVVAGDEEITRLLLSRGADPNLAMKDGTTPLDIAESNPDIPQSIREVLIAAGARRSAQSV